MNLKNFIEGISILSNYYDNQEGGYHLGAEHDTIYLYSTGKPLSTSDVCRMHELGWWQDDCDSDKGEYDQDSSWCAFV